MQSLTDVETYSEAELKIILSLSPEVPSDPEDPTNQYLHNELAIELGRKLFFDPRLSGNQQISCASCHDPDKGWSDGQRFSKGAGGATVRHSPSLYNVAWQRWFNWDGRHDTLWSQASGPIESSVEMNGDRLSAFRLIAEDRELRELYQGVFGDLPEDLDLSSLPQHAKPDPTGEDTTWSEIPEIQRKQINIAFVHILKSLAAFESRIISFDSPFDHYVQSLRQGQANNSISDAAKRGLRLFITTAQCHLCHNSPLLSDLEFHNLGWEHQEDQQDDLGRHLGIGKLRENEFSAASAYSDDPQSQRAQHTGFLKITEEQMGQFKTPSLRNVAESAPYMHDGRLQSLDEVLLFYTFLRDVSMGRPLLNLHQVGHRAEILTELPLSQKDRQDLVEFLRSLSSPSQVP